MANRSPCGACKFLRRRCVIDCIFAPYFCSNQAGSATFADIHKVFGASNVSKLLLQLPARQRHVAIVSITFEAQARLQNPIFGCVSHIISLQQQVINLQGQLMQARAQQAQYFVNPINIGNQWVSTMVGGATILSDVDPTYLNMTNWQPQNSLQYSIDHYKDGHFLQQEIYNKVDGVPFPSDCTNRMTTSHPEISELQALALMMTKTDSKF